MDIFRTFDFAGESRSSDMTNLLEFQFLSSPQLHAMAIGNGNIASFEQSALSRS